jgi:hypothetical protein
VALIEERLIADSERTHSWKTAATVAPLMSVAGGMGEGQPIPPEFFHSEGFAKEPGGESAMHSGDPGCHPTCWWACNSIGGADGSAGFDEMCTPVCAPPQCETACSPINLATCTQACSPPNCAIVCPQMQCTHGSCPQCQTICAPPECKTVCAEQCESKCNEPSCTWKCEINETKMMEEHPPSCSLKCGGAKMCNFDKNVGKRPAPWPQGMDVMSAGLAAFDPAALTGGAPPPPAAEAPAPADPVAFHGGRGPAPAQVIR